MKYVAAQAVFSAFIVLAFITGFCAEEGTALRSVFLIHNSWHAHIAKARTRVKNAADNFDARQAALDADLAEDYAYDAITFALNAIDEAESATLTAMYARANPVAQRA